MKTCAVLAVVLCLLPGSLEGQSREWWRVAAIQRELGLTPSQVASIEAIFRATHRHRLELHERLARVQTALDDAIARADEEMAVALIGPVEAARSERNKARIMMLMRMYRVLTLQQRRGLTALQGRRPSSKGGIPASKR